ncbi:glycosyltransferase family 4 protein [Pseudonocardia sp. KRD291]|uniref:glycosyltransferase family 4 protein n=1 Tax=Pseudonocardia sp. KRD291 TaxID=2792007 RepID=UPI001CF7C399|nr:glycosyltransferase family 4 protein [Pseudonocardia sp. KRD291]
MTGRAMTGSGMRVLHAINEMGDGGAERMVADLARGGTSHGWTSAVLSSGGRRADELAVEGVATYAMPLARRSPVALLRSALRARRAARAFAPDVVVAHNVLVSLVLWVALHTLRRRPALVTVFHGVGAPDHRGAARLLSRTSDVVVAVSGALADRLRGAGLTGTRLTVVRNAVTAPAPGDHGPDRAAARERLGLPPDRRIVLCPARMVAQKRHDVLLDAWWRLPGDALLLLAGDGPLRAGLETAAAPQGDRVRFLGNRSDVDELLRAADVTVLTSDWEGLPMVVLESLAAGRPMVATDVDGVREVLGDGAGLLVAPGDPDAVAAALARVLDEPDTAASLVRAGHAVIARDHDPDAMLGRYDDVLRGARHAGPPGRPGRVWVATAAVLAGALVAVAVFAGVLAQPGRYQGTVGVVARPASVVTSVALSAGAAGSTNYGEVVSLALPSLPELATGPTLLAAAAAQVPGAPSGEDLRPDVSVELLPGSGVARISVRSGDPELAGRLTEAVTDQVVRARPLAPAGELRAIDRRASVSEVSASPVLGAAFALLAGLVAAAATAALLLPRRRDAEREHAALLRALGDAGRDPVAVLDAADPVLASRVRILARDAGRPLRVVAAGPGLQDRVRSLRDELAPVAVLAGAGRPDEPAAVLAVADRRRTRTDELAGIVSALPESGSLLAVVLV